MKRLFILASAAIVALASCTKTHVVYNEAPEEINFEAYVGVMKKAADAGTSMPETMGVFAYDEADKPYFGNTSYSPVMDEDGVTVKHWGATADAIYWPVSGELTFTAYAPYSTAASCDNEKLTLTEVGTTQDWLYATEQVTGSKSANALELSLAHALTQVVVNFSASENVTLTSVTLNDTWQTGTCEVDYTAGTVVPVWSHEESDTKEAVTLLAAESEVALTTAQEYVCLVVPNSAAEASLTFTYMMGTSDVELEYTVQAAKLGTWASGKRYVYNVALGASEITFTPTVTGWDTTTPAVDAMAE